MATLVTWNSQSFSVPATGEENWGGSSKVDGLLISLVNNGFQKTGGVFTLSADADFGASAGLKSNYYKSRSSNLSTSGSVRLARTDTIGWRNAANGGNLLLAVNASDQLTFNGATIIGMSPSLSINTALVSDGTGTIISSAVTATELGRLSGVGSTVAGISDTATFTNKKLSDSTCSFVDDGDDTKQLKLQCSGITTATTRTWTAPDADLTVTGIATTQTLTNKTISNSENTLSHIDGPDTLRNFSISCSVGSSALTIALKDASGSDCSATSKAFASFRSATAGTGTFVTRTVSGALSLVISSGSTLGLVSGSVAQYVYVYLIDNAGTLVLAASGLRDAFSEGELQSSTAEGGAGAADTAATLYSTAAQSTKAVRLIARLKFSLATAGTWDEVPDEISLVPFEYPKAPTIQKFTSGSATYNTPAGVKWLRVRMVGGGGGGGSSGTGSFGAATAGTDTTFGASTAGGGGAGSQGGGGGGGTATLGSGHVGLAVDGAVGMGNLFQNITTVQFSGGSGGSSAFGGAGSGNGTGGGGTNAKTNSGSGGGGAGTSATAGSFAGSGGGAGAFLDFIIAAPLSSYAYTVGSSGSGGSAGTNGFAGGNGSIGQIIVEEHYV